MNLVRVCPQCAHESAVTQTGCPKCGHTLGRITFSTSLIRYTAVVLFMGLLAFLGYVTYLLFTLRT